MNLIISLQAQEELKEFKHSGQTNVVKKIEKLLEELQEHPFTGTGKPEALKYNLTGVLVKTYNAGTSYDLQSSGRRSHC